MGRERLLNTYLQHVAEYVHALEYGEPELGDAFGVFLRRRFLLLHIHDSSFFLDLLLQTEHSLKHFLENRKMEICVSADEGRSATWSLCELGRDFLKM